MFHTGLKITRRPCLKRLLPHSLRMKLSKVFLSSKQLLHMSTSNLSVAKPATMGLMGPSRRDSW